MSKTMKILLVILLIILLLGTGILAFLYTKSQESANSTKTERITKVQKDPQKTELSSLSSELKETDDLDLTELDTLTSELGEIDTTDL